MESDLWTPGAWPSRGLGPREGLRPGLRWPSHRDSSGDEGPNAWGTRSGAWRKVGHNLWVPVEVDSTVPCQRVVEAAAQLPSYGGVTGWAGLRWMGGVWFGGVSGTGELRDVPVAVSSGHRMRPRPGVRVSHEVVAPRNLMRYHGVRVTEPLWSVAYEMRKAASDEAAVVAFDMAAFSDLVSIEELRAYVDIELVARQGVERVRRVLPLLDENAWSPMEPVMQLSWRQQIEGVEVLMNRPVFDCRGQFVGTPDGIDDRAGVYVMYDGALHLAGAVRHGDVAKEAAYRDVGLEGVVMMAGDLADRAPFEKRLREAYGRAARRPASERTWSLETPAWWIDTTSVAARRALSAAQRRRLLAHRQRAA